MLVENIHVTNGATSLTTDARLALIGTARGTLLGLPEPLIASVVKV
jgi:hypothetical protein